MEHNITIDIREGVSSIDNVPEHIHVTIRDYDLFKKEIDMYHEHIYTDDKGEKYQEIKLS